MSYQVSYTLGGRCIIKEKLDEARAAAQAGSELNSGFNIQSWRSNPLSDNPIYLAGRERIYEGMRLAGVPEG